jgi:uncharacterized repeat protein (TIGR03803 family)
VYCTPRKIGLILVNQSYIMKKLYLALITLACFNHSGYGQSELWGMTTTGGGAYGTIYGLPTGSTGIATQYTFTGYQGSSPQHTKLALVSGKMYGLTSTGGSSNLGVLFEYDPSNNSYVKKVDFTGTATGSTPRGALTLASNGKLYGMTASGGANGFGVIFEYDVTNNIYTKKVDFTGTSGAAMGSQPYGTLTQAPNGKLYGMTRLGGSNSAGVIFEYDYSTNTYTNKFNMASATGSSPYGQLVIASNGNMYGLASGGGTNSLGVLFEYDYVNNVYTSKVDLSSTTGTNPQGSLMVASNGKLYGMTLFGGANNLGTIIEYSVAATSVTTVVDMASSTGATSSGELVQASNGKLYGLARTGGNSNQGTIFELDPSTNTLTKKADLANTTTVGGSPFGSMIISSGKLYGLTSAGGTASGGVLFEYDLTGNTYTKKIDLNSSNGGFPNGHLIRASDGKIYGMTLVGGNNNAGIIFEYNKTTNTLTKKIDLISTTGSSPYGSLVQATNGKLYGLTSAGGSANVGTLFEYDYSTNTYTKKVDLTATNGSVPYGSLIQASNGKLYGMTKQGGTSAFGTIFEYNITTNTYTKLVNLTAVTGYSAFGSLMEASNGKLYGLTMLGGTNGQGTLFELDPSTNTFTKKVDLATATGGQPSGSLVQAANGNLYGMTKAGGANSAGVIFEYNISTNTYTSKIDLTVANGSVPLGSLIKAVNGNLYGVTSAGGTSSLGALFEYNPTTNTYTKKFDFTGTNGSSPGYTQLLEICNMPELPGAITTSSNALCQGSTVNQVSSIPAVSNATSYTWVLPAGASVILGSTTTTVTANLAGLSAGTYTYGAAGVNVCGTGSLSVSTVTVHAPPVISANSGTICDGTSFTIVPTGAATYTYSGGSNIVSPSTNTNYSVTGTSAFGCAASNTAISSVTVIPKPFITVNSGSVCAGNPFTITATGASTYIYSSGSNVVTPSSSTNYSVTGISAAGCVSSNTAISSVTVAQLPVITVNSGSICAGSSFTIIPTGAASYSYQGGSNVVTPSSTTSYTVSGVSAAGCVSSNTPAANITVVPLPVISASGGAICAGSSFTINPTGATTYSYQGGSQVVSPGTTTSYTVVGYSNGCESMSISVNVTVNPLPVITISGPTDICEGETATLTANGGAIYNWGTSTSPQLTVNPTVTTTYSVQGTDVNGCSALGGYTLTVNPLPTITVFGGAICPGNSFTLVPSGATTYTYSSGSNVVTPLTTTSYSVSGTNSLGCTSLLPGVATVSVVNILTVTINGDNTICSGDSVVLTANGASTYSWNTGETSNVIIKNPTVTTTYTVIGASGTCYDTTYHSVNVNQLPSILVGSSATMICLGESAVLSASGALSYSWNVQQGQIITVSPTVTTVYTVTGTDANGCKNSTTITLPVSPCDAISEESSHLFTSVYPNPTNGEFFIEAAGRVNIIIYDALGKVILKKSLVEGKNSVNLTGEPRGMYFIALSYGGRTETLKLIHN